MCVNFMGLSVRITKQVGRARARPRKACALPVGLRHPVQVRARAQVRMLHRSWPCLDRLCERASGAVRP